MAKQEAMAACRHEYAQAFEQLLAGLEKAQAQLNERVAAQVVQLSLCIAEKIINLELEKNDTVFVGLVRQAIDKLGFKSEFILRLNEAAEYHRHFADGGKWLASGMDCAHFSVVMDHGVPPGGCVLESEDSVVRVGVDAQLKMIGAALERQTEKRGWADDDKDGDG
jgi:flagellar biosynthesis/type III secretory pathway protein FliH